MNGDRVLRWNVVAESLSRPYPVSVPMIALVLIVPFYIFIADFIEGRAVHAPALALDRLLPLQPAWALVYGSLYLFLILLPLFVVRDETLIRRTLFAYLTIWLTAYVCFFAYPTIAPRPLKVVGDGFAMAGLRFLYGADPPYNCFPSLHVAHSFVSAFACRRVHRGVGAAAIAAAALVGLSTLFTKQHYALDVAGGVLLASIAAALFLRKRVDVAAFDRRAAPLLATALFAAIALAVAALWLVHSIAA